ncbi:sulfatase [Pacificoceanicola onchidii]|uniref:sulfatase n=1 Tax=Pacificoceanicola onchidii TaxID=2562685 RepID=UPI0010A5E0EC|nr:sulfatase [Pacificoceanicola onchidii]
MKVLFVLFDSLNRNAIGAYGGNWIETPNFDRFAQKSVRFDNHYVGSMPCMPARRDLHTGRLNFMHRSWGPLEPFDNSMIRTLKDQGIWSHMITDHSHYWMEGGATYHTQYSSFDFIRGQEKDRWKAMVQPPLERFREMYHSTQTNGLDEKYLPYMISREHQPEEADMPLAKCMASAHEFLDMNGDKDGWLCHLECFDPHEPFWSPERFQGRRDSGYEGPILDWPRYDKVSESAEEIEELRNNYAGLVEMCDEYFGKLLDHLDRIDAWEDTVVILATDHGFLLGEHEWWAKNITPYYNEIANIPLMIYHPDHADQGGTSRKALTQTMDLMPTILSLFDAPIPDNVEGQDLTPLLAEDAQGHSAVAYGVFGGAVNVTDGRYTYFKYPEEISNQELYEYTLMPTHLEEAFSVENLAELQLSEPLEFAQGLKLMKIPARAEEDGAISVPCMGTPRETETVLYDLQSDPGQYTPIEAPEVVERLENALRDLMTRHHAPEEAYRRIGL